MKLPLRTANDLASLAQKVTEAAAHLPKDGIPDIKTHRALRDATKQLFLALETPGDLVQRVAFSPLQASVVRAGLDLGIFDSLVNAGPEGRSVCELVRITGAERLLLVRILRYLAAIDIIGQIHTDRYVATFNTKPFTVPTLVAGVKNMFDFVAPIWLKLPKYLANTSWRNPADATNGPLQYTYSTNLDAFSYLDLPGNEKMLRNLEIWIAGQRQGFGFHSDWLDFFPFQSEVLDGYDGGENGTLMVDIGGGLGHEMRSLRRRFPRLPGKLIVQDLPQTIAEIRQCDGVFEPMVHNIFKPQPVKDARLYYLKTVLHDWPDSRCRSILQSTVAAMKEGYSMLIINETVVPDVNAGVVQSQLDFTMMATFAASERSERDWRDLLASTGLRVVKIWRSDELAESVIVAVPDKEVKVDFLNATLQRAATSNLC